MTNATQLRYHQYMKNIAREGEQICEEWGLRKTKTRLALFQAFYDASAPLTIKALLRLFARAALLVDKTTVYREVEKLVALGVLRTVQLTPRTISYELASHDHHHHFACTNCDFVTDVVFPEASIQKTEALLETEGMLITNHSLEFFGLCKNCN